MSGNAGKKSAEPTTEIPLAFLSYLVHLLAVRSSDRREWKIANSESTDALLKYYRAKFDRMRLRRAEGGE